MKKKDLIIESIQKMDINRLQDLLSNSYTYDGATKETFLKKLQVAFSDFNKSGDSFLTSYEGACNYKDCGCYGCSGLSFIGNNSNNYLDLIFEEENNDFIDIRYCGDFKTHLSIPFKNEAFSVDISLEDYAHFKPSELFISQSKECKVAIEELKQYQKDILIPEIYMPWVEKYEALYNSLDSLAHLYPSLEPFEKLYSLMNCFYLGVKNNEIDEIALKEFPEDNFDSELTLLKWLCKYEEHGFESGFTYNNLEDYPEINKVKYIEKEGFRVRLLDFKDTTKFRNLFLTNYDVMLDKHTTFTNDEACNTINGNDDEKSENFLYLSYHLKKRGILS